MTQPQGIPNVQTSNIFYARALSIGISKAHPNKAVRLQEEKMRTVRIRLKFYHRGPTFLDLINKVEAPPGIVLVVAPLRADIIVGEGIGALANGESSDPGWWYDGTAFLFVRLPPVPITVRIEA